MIRYLQHGQIDKTEWDKCISKARNRRIYAYSWYLDQISPAWEALAEDDYSSVFPLTWNRKAGIFYLYQPYFAQQLGVFSESDCDPGRVGQFLGLIPEKFSYIDINLNWGCSIPDSIPEFILRKNHELDLGTTYERINENYSQNTKRNIRKAGTHSLNTGKPVQPEELVSLFRHNFGRREKKLEASQYATIRGIIYEAMKKGQGEIRGVYDSKGFLSAGAFFLSDKDRKYFLFAASGPEARENGAMFLLIDNFIRENSGKPLILDFEGGNDPDLGRFYKSFGASEILYPRIIIDHLPYMQKLGVAIVRQIREWRKQIIFVKI